MHLIVPLILVMSIIAISGILIYKRIISLWVHIIIIVSALIAQNIWYYLT